MISPGRLFSSRASLLRVGMLAGVLAVLLAGCGSSSSTGDTEQPVTLNVFAAASLQAAFTEIGNNFHTAHSNVTVTNNFAGSDALATQINQGAPADVYASANSTQMSVVQQAGNVEQASVKTFAHNRLVVVIPKGNPGGITTLQDLAKSGVKVVLAAATVPVGGYAITYLTQASADPSFGTDYKANVLKNVVSYEADVKSVLTKVSLGEADAGIVYTTDAATITDGSIMSIDIPDALNTIATYPIAPVKGSKNAATAQQFVDYVMSSDGQAVLAKYGFIAGSDGPAYQYAPPSGS